MVQHHSLETIDNACLTPTVGLTCYNTGSKNHGLVSHNHIFWFTVNTVQSGGLRQVTHHSMKELTYERMSRHLREDVSVTLHQWLWLHFVLQLSRTVSGPSNDS
jgi:hypothetical protein